MASAWHISTVTHLLWAITDGYTILELLPFFMSEMVYLLNLKLVFYVFRADMFGKQQAWIVSNGVISLHSIIQNVTTCSNNTTTLWIVESFFLLFFFALKSQHNLFISVRYSFTLKWQFRGHKLVYNLRELLSLLPLARWINLYFARHALFIGNKSVFFLLALLLSRMNYVVLSRHITSFVPNFSSFF